MVTTMHLYKLPKSSIQQTRGNFFLPKSPAKPKLFAVQRTDPIIPEFHGHRKSRFFNATKEALTMISRMGATELIGAFLDRNWTLRV